VTNARFRFVGAAHFVATYGRGLGDGVGDAVASGLALAVGLGIAATGDGVSPRADGVGVFVAALNEPHADAKIAIRASSRIPA
jgi:hypothetical protein